MQVQLFRGIVSVKKTRQTGLEVKATGEKTTYLLYLCKPAMSLKEELGLFSLEKDKEVDEVFYKGLAEVSQSLALVLVALT